MTTDAKLRALLPIVTDEHLARWNAACSPSAVLSLLDRIDAQSKRIAELEAAMSEAYGYLWHVNNEPMWPIPMYSPEKAAYEARKRLRDLLTKEQRGNAINTVGQAIGRFDAAIKGA